MEAQGMVERIARAIYEKRNGAGCRPWSRQNAAYQAPYIDDAKAAINAIRPTTNAMDVAGCIYLRDNPSDASGTFESMIDAALNEHG